MAVTVVKFTANQSDTTAGTLQTTIQATAANSGIVVAIFWKGAETVSSVTGGGTYADSGAGKLARPTDGNLQFFGSPLVTTGTTTVTVNWSDANASSIEAFIWEVTGQNTSTLFDSASGTGTASSGTALTTSSFTPTASGDLILSFASADPLGTPTGDTGYTVEYNPADQGIVCQDKGFTSGAQTTTATMANAMTKGGIMSVVAKVAAAAGGAIRLRFPTPLTGVGSGNQFLGERL
jgi:hypothetical protein